MIRPLCLFFSMLALGSCIEPYYAKIPDGARPLVVDALITDQPGPYYVRLFRAASLNDPYGETDNIQGAKITISDDLGNSDQLVEGAPGSYHTNSIQGAIGRTYKLRIETTSGDVFESSEEEMLPAGDFSNLRYQYVQNTDPFLEDQSNPTNGFNIFLDATLAPEQQGLVRWRYIGTFEVRTYPELRLKVKVPSGPVITFVPDPPRCSGWVVPIGKADSIVQVDVCTCCYCWVSQYNTTPLLSDKKFVSGNKIDRMLIDFIPINKNYFNNKYYLEVQQMSVTPAVYGFWKRVSAQRQQSTDLFQTPPPTTVGNVFALTSGSSQIVGVFSASAIVKHSVVLHPSDIPYHVEFLDTVANDCRVRYLNSSIVQPDFW